MITGKLGAEIILRDDVVFVLPSIPDNAPPLVREGIARRRLAALEDECPCGGRSPLNRAISASIDAVDFVHESGCLAVDDILVEAIRAWSA
jgi:hypothetical protein